MDETGRDKGDFHGDLRARQDGEGGGTGRCLKHQWKNERRWHSRTRPRQ